MTNHFGTEVILDVENVRSVESYLKGSQFMLPEERLLRLEVAGEGNMNVVLRATTDQRSFILKQPRPWVRKFPSVAAPISRINVEYQFYRTVRSNAVIREYTPEVYWFDEENLILCMEDLGPSSDFTNIYRKDTGLQRSQMADIARVVSELHFQFKDMPDSERVQNLELRQLNHAHIFQLPLEANNGFDLDAVIPGMQAATVKFRTDEVLKKRAKELGEVYLGDSGNRLLHGDYYPGSWLNTEKGFRMIDPEFCFTGPAEFELAVCVAHLKMAQQPDSIIKDLFVYYHFDSRFDGSLFSKFSGMEMIRRLIGLAQLPLELDLKERLSLLEEAYELVVSG
ncbi:MAG: aminoglycoside phosphotransferase [Bacteroidetes bacterium]|nr:MAG: aminoglycoside phosphotransferase [Bacteroidota bacterium]